jgi:hypothetical protein
MSGQLNCLLYFHRYCKELNFNGDGRAVMEKSNYTGMLKDEYVMLQQFYEDIDEKGLNIKNWSVTVALATIGAGLVYHKNILLLTFAAAVMFWILEGYWRGLSYFFVVRIKEIEKAFADGQEEQKTPLQVYSTWGKAYDKNKDQTLIYMFKFNAMLPHVAIAVISLLLYFLNGALLP